jgi:glyoxylase I family protein
MKIEHVALQVENPSGMADWYTAQLGFQIRRATEQPVQARFLADDSGQVMLEVYRNPDIAAPDYRSLDPRLLHVALWCDDVPAEAARLVKAGAGLVSGPEDVDGNHFAMLRDPWGLPLQLVRRAEPLV